ncbi:esterase-like activity of phytase family protein [Parerythrobacter aurantius]|uniref:esterase-like activity of phytase family protein n=1 Tax=Parerythrobacter aurantius TaxID=3127706 RepID=UPI003248515A
MNRRRLLLFPVALVLALGTCVRSPEPAKVLDAPVVVRPMEGLPPTVGPFRVTGAWTLQSRNSHFGGYSALVARRGGTMLAASDRGAGMTFRIGRDGPEDLRLFPLADPHYDPDKYSLDIESMTADPAGGQVWLAFEAINMIERREPGLDGPVRVRPQAMADWGGNSGPEAMIRLADGRFIVVREGRQGWFSATHPALLWNGDPVRGGKPAAFGLQLADRFRPTDMTLLPDGRVLLLARRLVLDWPVFEAALLVADPQEIRAGKAWQARELARFAAPFPTDNFEGLAVDPGRRYPVTISLISDDNGAELQRTLLLRLQWDGRIPR